MLSNPIYAGEVRHKGRRYPGRHAAIIDRNCFEAVQQQLSANALPNRSGQNSTEPSLLTGLIHDETGDRLTPTHANKKGRRYRYYVSHRLLKTGAGASGGWRVPARELEALVLKTIADLLIDEHRVLEAQQWNDVRPDSLRRMLDRAASVGVRCESAQRNGSGSYWDRCCSRWF